MVTAAIVPVIVASVVVAASVKRSFIVAASEIVAAAMVAAAVSAVMGLGRGGKTAQAANGNGDGKNESFHGSVISYRIRLLVVSFIRRDLLLGRALSTSYA